MSKADQIQALVDRIIGICKDTLRYTIIDDEIVQERLDALKAERARLDAILAEPAPLAYVGQITDEGCMVFLRTEHGYTSQYVQHRFPRRAPDPPEAVP